MSFSPKQKEILRWPYTGKTALICDGAVRSGKTSVMSLAYILWAMNMFSGCNFGICGKTVGSAERNVIMPLLTIKYLQEHFALSYSRSTHVLTVGRGGRTNQFYIFGGRDESSYTLIQGITLAGVMLDEIALMPRSFVEQAIARCSVDGSKFWFNCNPEGPEHWFRKEWILEAEKKCATHLHFTMRDNPSLSEETITRYESMYSGVFYQRYIEGRWVMSEGVIYDMFDPTENTYTDAERPRGLQYVSSRYIAVDYGTTNPCVFLNIYDDGETVWVDDEYRWDSRKKRSQKTDSQYADDMVEFMGQDPQFQCPIVCDPSAASFLAELRSRGFYAMAADNEVLDGIRRTAALFKMRRIMVHKRCAGLIDELGTYVWDDKASNNGVEKPIKANDHGADALRYFCNTALPKWRVNIE